MVRISEVHLKDNLTTREGKIDFRAVVDALADVGFDGWLAKPMPTRGGRHAPEPEVYPGTDCFSQRRLKIKPR